MLMLDTVKMDLPKAEARLKEAGEALGPRRSQGEDRFNE